MNTKNVIGVQKALSMNIDSVFTTKDHFLLGLQIEIALYRELKKKLL